MLKGGSPMFIDIAKIVLKAGDGGDGAVAFHREKYVASGGPDGGDGGRGGNIVFQVDDNLSTLADFRYKRKYTAQRGENGRGNRCFGKSAPDLVVCVPRGTVVKDAETGRVIADMSGEEPQVIARGGKGGWGNTHFATPTRQTPRFSKPGTPGEELEVQLELKLLADVGLVGFPNVGKSTLISVVSEAKPNIANYHFTTLTPVLGVVRMQEGKSFVMADIPGLIEGAWEGVGLGHQFLRHVERCRLLLHIVDVSGSEGRDPKEDFRIINGELARYGEPEGRPQLVVLNKCDLIYEDGEIQRLKQAFEAMGYEAFPVSAAQNRGFDALLDRVVQLLGELPPPRVFEAEEAEESHVLPDDGFTIRRENDTFYVEGAAMQRFVDSVNFDDEESLNWFHRTLRDRGIIQALRDKGAGEGSTVSIGDMEFDFIE